MTTQQPEALQCAADLEAQLEAIGAGGVSGPLIGQPQAMPDLSQLTERGAVAWAGVDAQGLREGRWYMVTHDGMATLCANKADAQQEAADAQRFWPHMGPHRAVQLVEAADVEAMRAGYDAARLVIESLKSQLHAVKQINAAQFGLLAASIPGSARPGK